MRRVALIFGPGRSGTSAVAQIASALDLSFGEDLLAAEPTNPDGFYEDRLVVSIHRDLIESFGCIGPQGVVLPMPDNWMSCEATHVARGKLVDRVSQLLELSNHVAIKDPRISVLLPLWRDVFDEVGAEGQHVMCLRSPAAMASSFASVAHVDPRVGESVWLGRVMAALANWPENGFIIHYEQLAADPRGSIMRLAKYLRPEVDDVESRVEQALTTGLVKSNLNRHGTSSSPRIGLAGDIHAALNSEPASEAVAAANRLAPRYWEAIADLEGWAEGLRDALHRLQSKRAREDRLTEQRDAARAKLQRAVNKLDSADAKLRRTRKELAELKDLIENNPLAIVKSFAQRRARRGAQAAARWWRRAPWFH